MDPSLQARCRKLLKRTELYSKGLTIMTISKKLTFIMSLALSIASIAQGYYGVYELNNEQQCMLNFCKELRQQNNVNAENLASWIEKKAYNYYPNEHDDIVTLVNIINDSALTIESKITLIYSKTIEKEAKEQRNQKIKKYAKIACGTVAVGILGVAALIAIDNSNTTVFNPGGGVQIRVNTSGWPKEWSNLFRP